MILRGDIYLVDLGEGKGSEQNGVRPCLIVQNNVGNKHSTNTIVCPITSRTNGYTATHMRIDCLIHTSYVLFEQVRVVSKERLLRKLATLDHHQMAEADYKLRLTLSL